MDLAGIRLAGITTPTWPRSAHDDKLCTLRLARHSDRERAMSDQNRLPSRLHHTAYVTRDLEATRRFYEDLLGFPLIATWCESDELFGAVRTYCHCFFGIGDAARWPSSSSRSPRIKNSSGRRCRPPRFITSRSNAMPRQKTKSRSDSSPQAIESPTALSSSMATARHSTSQIPTA